MTDPSRERRILIVDDEPGFREMLRWNLKEEGILIETASDGADAEEKMTAREYALVLTDITMPRVDGLSLLRRIKERNPALPIVIMTGFGTVETAVQAMKDGAVDFVLKPFDVSSMIRRVRRILGLPVNAKCSPAREKLPKPGDELPAPCRKEE